MPEVQPSGQLIEECESTNDLCRALGEKGAPEGSWVSARRQSRGRGRLGREWASAEGNLFFSLLARPLHRERASWIPIAAGVAAVRAVRRLGGPEGLRLKWPNDLWLGPAKAGGILCEGVSGPRGFFVVIGIGINCRSAPGGLGQAATSLGVDVDGLRPLLAEELRACLRELDSAGPAGIREAYEAQALFQPGTPVSWAGERGVALGLDASGGLRVRRDRDGVELTILAEDVSIRPVGDQPC